MTTLVHSGHKSISTAHLTGSWAGATDPHILGQYRILECLGSGGMGKVFRAEHQLMGRQVAIKVMSPALLSDPDSCARFRQEVRLVARLSHPNIVLAHDADEEQGLHFFVMEYVSGADLGQIVGEYGPLPIPFACECIRQAALGLQHAHEHGLVHCDIKPSNLLLRNGITSVYNFLGRTPGGERPLIKILDFGLARLAGRHAEPDLRLSSPDSCLCGTPDFMAPELGRDSTTVDIRCDLYSLGCTFSFVLTGQVPYPGGSWSEKLIRHHYDPAVPVCQMRPDVPAAIAQIVSRLMAKDPVDRFSTPGEVAEAIAAWQGAEPFGSSISLSLPESLTQQQTKQPDSVAPTFVNGAPKLDESTPSSNIQSRRTSRRPRMRLAWPVAVGLAVAMGLGSAWVVSCRLQGQSALSLGQKSGFGRPEGLFHVVGSSRSFSGLEQAVSAAKDGDTILVSGNGPFVFHGLSLRGKSLTIKAAADWRPRFDLIPPKESSWEPLLVTNRPLTLEGLHLNYGGEKASSTGPGVAHLVYSERAALKLVNCTLTGTSAQALVVGRQSPNIDIEGCSISANGSAICAEVCEQGLTKVRLARSQFVAHDHGAAAVAIWASGTVRDGCQLELEENELDGARSIAINNLDGLTSIRANKNNFHFSDALISILSRNASQLSQLVRWQGTRNRFAAGAQWVTWNSEGLGVKSLVDWRKCWSSSETDSLMENTVALPTGSPRSN